MRIVIWQHLVLLLLMNIIVDVICLISGIYINFRTFLCKKCDVGYYVINHGVYRRRLCCNKICALKQKLQRKFLTHAKIKYIRNCSLYFP